MSKLPESDGGRQKGNLRQSRHGLRQRTHGLVSFWRSSGDKNAYLMPSNTPMQFSRTRMDKWYASHTSWWSGHQDGLLPLAVRLLLQIKCCQSDKLRRLLCLLHKWHTVVSPPLLRHRLNRSWSRKLCILCNRSKITVTFMSIIL